MKRYYNAHIHVFNGNCAPKDFLQVGVKLGDGMAAFVKGVVSKPPFNRWIHKLASSRLKKKIEFIDIGVMSSQREIFQNILSKYDGSEFTQMRFIALTIDMDYMTDEKNKPYQNFLAQISEVVELKKHYPDRIFPFLGIDPRNPLLMDDNWLIQNLKSNVFSGIKIYPAKGFFPFDERLDKVYKYAASNNIPIMTHCTRSGSYYIGKNPMHLVPDKFDHLDDNDETVQRIYSRIKKYKLAFEGRKMDNSFFCNVFSHPENYLPVLKKYPNLTLCLAHLGGVGEILGDRCKELKTRIRYKKMSALESATETWYQFIMSKLMTEDYPNVYSDISYSLSSIEAMQAVFKDLEQGKLKKDRIMFGTDFFMISQEGDEIEIVKKAQVELKHHFSEMMCENVERYLNLK